MHRTSLGLLVFLVACGGSPRAVPHGPARAAQADPVTLPASAKVQRVVAAVAAARVRRDVDRLVGFGTRHTLSDVTSPTRGIGAARRWLAGELKQATSARGADLPPASVSMDESRIPADGKRVPRDVDVINVVATLPGTPPGARARQVLVTAHYDSRVTDVLDATSDAPGANDNASGVAVLLELARVLAAVPLESTVVLVATAGEEQGLLGARAYARKARVRNDTIVAVLNNDIVGDPSSRTNAGHRRRVRLFSEGLPKARRDEDVERLRQLGLEGESASRQLARFIADVAERERLPVRPTLVFRPDRFLRGGDQTAFNEAGYAAVRFTVPEEQFERQHENVRSEGGVAFGDVGEAVDADYLADVARLNAAAVMHLAEAPDAPLDVRVLTARLENRTRVAWRAPASEDVAGYEVLYRDTTETGWSHVVDVGPRLNVELPVLKDDVVIAARAYDHDGYRSVVALAGAAPE